MKSPLCGAILFGASVLVVQAEPDSGSMAKLDKVLRWPGNYSQICDANIRPFPAPIPGFRSIVHGEAGVSQKNMEFLKAHRAEILTAISAKLDSIDLFKPAKKQPLDPSIPKDQADATPIGADPSVYSAILLEIIEGLDAGEVFPALLKFEEKFNAALLKVEKDPDAPVPVMDALAGAGIGAGNLLKDGEEWDSLSETRSAEVEWKQKIFRLQLAQRDILAVFVRVMRKQGYEPMLSSDLEKEYGELLKEKWGDNEDLKKYKKASDIPEDERNNIKYDPIHKVAYLTWDTVQIPYTPEKRAKIRQLTKQFAEEKIKKKAP